MRRFSLCLLLLLASTTLVLAQDARQDDDDPLQLQVEGKNYPGNMIEGGQYVPVNLQRTDPPETIDPNSPEADAATDECTGAPVLDLAGPAGDGGQTFTRDMTTNLVDPDVSACMYGAPPSVQGHRSVWYQFTAPTSGRVVIESRPNLTFFDNYDTVIILHTGTCAALTQVLCNDDYNGFLSRAEGFVARGQTYYVEVVDWHLGVNQDAILNLVAWIESADSVWEGNVTEIPNIRSRHAMVAIDDEMYIISGQTTVGPNSTRTSRVDRYNVNMQTWVTAAPLLAQDGFGYSNGDAAVVGDRIYLPAGYVGDNDEYAGAHWVYDTLTNDWSTTIAAPFPNLPTAYYTVVEVPEQQGYYLIGGLNGPPLDVALSQAQDMMLFFRQGSGVVPDSWFDVFNPLTTPRYYHVAARLEDPAGWICVVGGLTNGNVFPTQGECFNPAGDWVPIDRLNIQRFGAESIVGPDGRWYVYGGYDVSLNLVAEVEVFNPPDPGVPGDLGSWQILDPPFNLEQPERAWPRGDVVGNRIWLTGGETYLDPNNTGAGSVALPIMQSVFFVPTLPAQEYFPFMANNFDGDEPNDNFLTATRLFFEEDYYSNFNGPEDYYDLYFVDLPAPGTLAIDLTNIPSGANYDVLLYTDNKVFLKGGLNVGNQDERVAVQGLPAGRYYIMVVRALPITGPPPLDNYRLFVEFIP